MPQAVSRVEELHDQPAQVAVVAGRRRVLLRALLPDQLHDPLRVLLLDPLPGRPGQRRLLLAPEPLVAGGEAHGIVLPRFGHLNDPVAVFDEHPDLLARVSPPPCDSQPPRAKRA